MHGIDPNFVEWVPASDVDANDHDSFGMAQGEANNSNNDSELESTEGTSKEPSQSDYGDALISFSDTHSSDLNESPDY
jgi:hypothetical protein